MAWSATEQPAATRPITRMGLEWLARALLGVIVSADQLWRSRQTRRALVELDEWQREDCGINRPDIPTRSRVEAAARRRLTDGMPVDWC
jgi:uncharacterized protein YjiS (DUF1127 family)